MTETLKPAVPEGEVPEANLFRSKIDLKTDQETGVTDPQGNWHKFSNGEKFALIRVEPGKPRQPFIIDRGGKGVPFDQWVTTQNKPSAEKAPGPEPVLTIDKARLNQIVNECNKIGARFGKEVQFDQADITEIEKILKASQDLLEKAKQQNQSLWDDFQRALGQLASTRAFILKDDIVDDGPTQAVESRNQKLTSPEGKTTMIDQVGVPTTIYRLYQWTQTVGSVETILRSAKAPDNQLFGTSAERLGADLAKIAQFLRDNKLIS